MRHAVVSQAEWLKVRRVLLAKEKIFYQGSCATSPPLRGRG